METDLRHRFARIQENLKKHDLTELLELRTGMMKSLDERIDRLIKNHSIIRRIKIPKHNPRPLKYQKEPFHFRVNVRYLVSTPFIYGMFVPAIFWHLCIEVYHQLCFRLYGIPVVRLRDYFVFDRQLFSWLNPWEKINCIYCSYVNNLIRYSAEIGGRTERYWCPIKYYRRIANPHSQYQKFVATSDPEKFREQWEELRDFSDLK